MSAGTNDTGMRPSLALASSAMQVCVLTLLPEVGVSWLRSIIGLTGLGEDGPGRVR